MGEWGGGGGGGGLSVGVCTFTQTGLKFHPGPLQKDHEI